MSVKREIEEQYPHGFSNDEEKKDYAKALADRRKNNREEILAAAAALEYVAGMADGTMLEVAKLKGYLTDEIIIGGYKREGEPEKQLADMQKFWNEEVKSDEQVILAIENILKGKDESRRVELRKINSTDDREI